MLPTLVVLHGVNAAASTMAPLTDLLRDRLDVRAADWLGHGGRPVPDGYRVADIAEDLVAWLDREQIDRPYVFGHSFGAYLALYLARHYPHRLRGIATLAAKYVYDDRTVRHLSFLASPDRLARPGNPRPAEMTRDHFPQDWVRITSNNRDLFTELGRAPALTEDDIRAIDLPALIMSGETDPLVTIEETRALAGLIRRWRLATFPGSAHPLSATPLPGIADTLVQFITDLEQARSSACRTS
jgi:pimeloyl-ACP methyl ester carboxylesterase